MISKAFYIKMERLEAAINDIGSDCQVENCKDCPLGYKTNHRDQSLCEFIFNKA